MAGLNGKITIEQLLFVFAVLLSQRDMQIQAQCIDGYRKEEECAQEKGCFALDRRNILEQKLR